MSTQHDTSATQAHRLWLPALRAALKRIRYRRARRTPIMRMVDQATQTKTWPENTTTVDQAAHTPTAPTAAMSATVLDQATQTLAWLDDQQQLESQDEDHKEAGETGLRFMDLPLELRREVYRHYINNLPPLMHSSLQICREVADVTERVLTFRMVNGRCGPFIPRFDAAELAARRLASLCDQFQGENVRFRIELQCPNNFISMLEYHLGAVLKVIRANKMAPVEVYMTKGEVCSFCARHPDPDPDPARFVRRLAELVERMRDRRTVSYGVQTRCDCRGRRLE